jgi:L-2-hydroxycarboxylate dehydrogenase (NAD+)
MPLVGQHRLRRLYEQVAGAHGASEQEATMFADCLVRADLRGVTRQGIAVLPYYDRLLRDRVLGFGRRPDIVREGPSFASLDGHRNVGQVIGCVAMDLAVEKARTAGIGVVTVHNSGDFAMASVFAMRALEHDQIGIAMGNGYPVVAPWGGREPFFCTNPLAFAMPCGGESPLVIDMATSAYSMGHVVRAARDGKRLATPSVVDAAGRYTSDPREVVVDPMDRESDLVGALLPEGAKGFGWMLIVEALSGILSGAKGSYVNRVDPSVSGRTSYGHFFMAIDVGLLLGGAFHLDAEAFVRALRTSAPAKDFEAVRVPGVRGSIEERERARRGVPVRDEEWEMALSVAGALELDTSTI